MAATCAACGGLFAAMGEQPVIRGSLVAHARCAEGMPRSTWLKASVNRANVSDLVRQAQDARNAATSARLDRDNTRAELEMYRANAAAQAQRDREIGSSYNLQNRIRELERELERANVEVRSLASMRSPPAAPTRMPARSRPALSDDDRAFAVLGRAALGLAVGRGIYGLAAWITSIVLDSKDPSAQRFFLLELDDLKP